MRKLFTLLSAVLVSACAWAQFDEPELTLANSVKIDGTTEYKLSVTNAEGETYYYGKGNNWGTRTSAKMDVMDALTVRFHAITQTVDGEQVECVKFNNYVSDKGGWAAYADCDGGDQAWVDGQGRTGDGLWQVIDLGNGQIQLTNFNAPGGKFSFTPTRAQWSEDDQDYVLVESEDGYGFDNRLWFVGAPVDSVDVLDDLGEPTGEKRAAIVYGDEVYSTWQLWDATTYNLKMKFYNWFWNDMDNEGMLGSDYYDMEPTVKAACDKAMTVYDDPNATVEQLQAAYDEIMKAIGWLEVQKNIDLLEGATADEPIDLFEMGIAMNANYDDGSLDGWTANLRGNDNHRQGDRYSNNGVEINGFAESWTWNAQHSGDGDFTQKVGLPEGLYRLEVDMIATRQQGGKEDSKGVELFAKNTDGTEEFAIPVATANNAPEHFVLGFQTKGGSFIIGVRETAPTVNWIAMDNWKLGYYGKTTLTFAQIALRDKVSALTDEYGTLEVYGNQAVIDAYDRLYEEVAALAEAAQLSDEDCQLWSDSIQNAMNALKATINDYRVFAQRMEEVLAKSQDPETNPNAVGDLEDYYDQLQAAYEACEWTRTEIDEIYGVMASILGKYNGEMQPGDDVSHLLNNPKFAENFSGWNIEGATPGYMKNHGQGENANADLCQEAPAEDDGLAECFHALFDMSQTIYNLPKGLYTLSVQGFNRHDDGNNESAQLYATFPDGTEQVQDFASIDDYKTPDRLYVVGTWNEETGALENIQWMSDAGRDGDTYWVPNGMSGAAWHFMNKSDGKNYDYTNTFSIQMKEEGNLKVGVRVKNTHQWVIWDNFTLVYEGSGSKVWEPTLQNEIANLETRMDAADITDGEYSAISAVISEVEKFIADIENHTEDECMEQQALLRSQYAEITKNLELVAQVTALGEAMYNQEELADEADDELKERFYAAEDAANEGFYEMDNTELEALIEEINTVMTLIKMPKGWENASDENPVNFSRVIANSQFNPDGMYYEPDEEGWIEESATQGGYTFPEWTGNTKPGTGGGTTANCGEVWNAGAFNFYQDLSGLPAGTYVLSCQGFLRHGGGTADSYAIFNGEKEQTVYAYLYATSSEGKYSTELNNIASVQLDEDSLAVLGIDISGGNSTFGSIYKGADQLATANNFFKAGFYNNSITVKVGEDGVLRVGIEKINSVGQDWVVVDNFTLMYLGNGSSAELSGDEATPIEIVEAAPAQKAIFTITGLRVNSLAKPGLYIINGKKVLVK